MIENKRGFTLIELAISLVIIGIISGIGVTAIVTTLANQRRNLDAENNVDNIKNDVVESIYNHKQKSLPSKDEFNTFITKEKQGNFVYKFNLGIQNNVCDYGYSDCKIQICNNKPCDNPTVIPNILFSVLEKGPNKGDDSSDFSDPNKCNLKINKFDNKNDDIVSFATLENVRNVIGCDKAASSFRFLTEDLPIVYRNDFPKQGIKIEVTPIKQIGDYFWSVCMDTRDSDTKNLAINGVQYEIYNSNSCNNSSILKYSAKTTNPWIFLGKSNNNSVGIDPGVYRVKVLVRYIDPRTKTPVAITKDYGLTLTDK